jgi:hypothetical protein
VSVARSAIHPSVQKAALTRRQAAGVLAGALVSSSCGYHLAGQADLLPKSIQTIAVPAFANPTTRYKLTDRLPQAVTREFISRTRYRVVPDASQADAVLNGAVTSIFTFPTIFDPATGRASGVQVSVTISVTLTERTTGKVLFSRPALTVNERYEIATTPETFFDENDAALERMARQAARAIVSAVLENF